MEEFKAQKAEGKRKKPEDALPNQGLMDYEAYTNDSAKELLDSYTKFFGGLIKLDNNLGIDMKKLNSCISMVPGLQRANLLNPQGVVDAKSEECLQFAYNVIMERRAGLAPNSKATISSYADSQGRLKQLTNIKGARIATEFKNYINTKGTFIDGFVQVPGYVGKFIDVKRMVEYLERIGEEAEEGERIMDRGAERKDILSFIKALVLKKGGQAKKDIQDIFRSLRKLTPSEVATALTEQDAEPSQKLDDPPVLPEPRGDSARPASQNQGAPTDRSIPADDADTAA